MSQEDENQKILGKRRGKIIPFRVSEAEDEALEKATKRAGLKRTSDFIRKAIRQAILAQEGEGESNLFQEQPGGNWLPKELRGKETAPSNETAGAA